MKIIGVRYFSFHPHDCRQYDLNLWNEKYLTPIIFIPAVSCSRPKVIMTTRDGKGYSGAAIQPKFTFGKPSDVVRFDPTAPAWAREAGAMKFLTSSGLTLLAVCIAISMLQTPPALCGNLDGITMPETATVGEKALKLNGMGTRKATFLKIKVYVMGLYLEEKSQDGPAIAASDQAKRIVMHFVRGVAESDLQDAWQEGFEKNTTNLDSIKDQAHQFHGMQASMEEGEQIVIDFLDDTTTVTVKGEVKGTIIGREFQKILLLIWLGTEPPNQDLKDGVLGK